MAKIQNNFLQATVNKDLDERLTPNGIMTDATNFMVTSEDGGSLGVGKNVFGNVLSASLNDSSAIVIGSVSDDSNERIFFFAHSDTYDYVAQYNLLSESIEILLKSTANTGVLNFNTEYRISHSDIFVSVEDESLLSWTDGFNPPRIVGIERAKSYAVDGFTDKEISVMKPSPIFAPSINLVNVSSTETSSFLEDKFLEFAYRYKYEDGHYSAISSWSQVAFLPSSFKLDYQTYENLGMVNLANAVDISFNSGDRHVIGVDLLFKESGNQTVYVIDKFIKEEEGWTTPNQLITYNFFGNKIYSVLDESQYFRSFDNVPLTALTQARIGNRLIYGNFIEGRNIEEPVSLNVDYVSTSLVLDSKEGEVENLVTENLYSNIADFEKGIETAGSNPIDQMNYLTNEVEVRFSVPGNPNSVRFAVTVEPKSIYSSSVYSIYIKDGISGSIVSSLIDVSGPNALVHSRASEADLSVYVVSDDGMIYDLTTESRLLYISIVPFVISQFGYYAEDQLCYPKDGGYDATYQGDTIINYSGKFDFTDFDFVRGNQMRFDFELQSSLVYEVKPEFTYFYNLTNDYTDLDDFIANSNFKSDLEGTFSNSFVNGTNSPYPYASAEGTVISFDGFSVSSSGGILTITPPHVVYEVVEFSGIIENKDDFYIIRSVNFGLYSEDAFSSMHSERDYTCDIIYLDKEGRKTTVLSGGNTSTYVNISDSENVNKLRVVTLSNPPSWAKYYKFAVKETKRNYNTIYGNVIYADGVYRWIQIVGENKNKIKEGDILTLKSDYSGIVQSNVNIKVLEVSTQTSNFLPDNVTAENAQIVEPGGLYFKIKQGNFNMNIGGDSFVTYEGFLKRRYASESNVYTSPLFGEFDNEPSIPVFVPTPVKNGSQIRFFARMYQFKNGAFDQSVEVIKYANDDYNSMRDWWEAEIAEDQSWLNFAEDRLADYGWDGEQRFFIRSNKNGTQRSDVRVNIVFDVKFSSGTLIFENYDKYNLESSYFESVETYNVVNGSHNSGNISDQNTHLLTKTFNCFTFGNGCESNCIKDSFTGNKFYLSSNPSAISEDKYRQVNRYADLTYSGPYQESTNVNKLNEFNLSLANYKDDIEKKFGPIVKISSEQTDLLVFQEDRISKVLYGKDLLYNADATTNLSRIESVLGQQVIYGGDYGISFHPESFIDYGTNKFFTDTKRGTVMRLNDSNGLEEISKKGLTDYFKKLFRDNTIDNIIGSYDSFYDTYVLNIKYNGDQSVTWLYSDEAGGFLTKVSYNPDSIIKLNNEFISFKNGGVYLHNRGSFNTFYGSRTPSNFRFNFSQEPSTRKSFKTISIEGDDAWGVEVYTDLQNGYINQSDFENKEGVYYGYIRGNNSEVDTATLSVIGIGNAVYIDATHIIVGKELAPLVNIGDLVYNQNMQFIGTIQDIDFAGFSADRYTIYIDSTAGLSVGDFILSAKPQSVETSGMLGYYMNVSCTLDSTKKSEVYAVNAEVSKSFE